MSIAEGLMALGFQPDRDFCCRDDGDGPYIDKWFSASPRPTDQEITAAASRGAVPNTVTPAQAKITLFEAGLLDQVEALVADYPYRPVGIWWMNASSFERGHAYLSALGLEIGLTDEEIDTLFIAAKEK